MNAQIQEITDDCNAAQKRLHDLARRVSDDRWSERPEPGRWSVSECVEHLNMTSDAFLPRLKVAIEEARKSGGKARPHMKRGLLGWMLWKVMPPPVKRMKAKAPPEFTPDVRLSPAQIRARFDALQGELLTLLRSADGLPIDTVKIISPFGEKLRYNAFAAFGIIPRHQHRHLWQAEQDNGVS